MNLFYKLSIGLILLQAPRAAAQSPADTLLDKMSRGQFEISHYNTACYFALAGKPAMAFQYLQRAIDENYADPENTVKDQDLLSLHTYPQWHEILKQMEHNRKRQQQNTSLFFNQKTFWESKQFTTPYQPNLPEDQKIAGLSKLWSEVKYNFVNFDIVPEINIDSLYFAYLPRVRQSASTREYYRLLEEMAASLRDGHTNVYLPAELSDSVYTRPLVRTRHRRQSDHHWCIRRNPQR
ncbi:hypothetical protein MKQ68_07480 [Chitinophaga horti]|uniref:Tetratricopeptide repeat-containing protein n=1 Tax=Chitinophaga horti TaxID=2920382 RepID=A0ABY6J5P7_9BACT|nr:hypothetical protein [Chitinophaga horti]UYQ94933.1 hypothetical protein MKQ68_07480 [Chitinophaga horti]